MTLNLFDARTGTFVSKIIADDGGPFDQFGISVAIFGNTLAVGACGDNAGAAYGLSVAQLSQLLQLHCSYIAATIGTIVRR